MSPSFSLAKPLLLLFLFSYFSCTIAQSLVPLKDTFTIVLTDTYQDYAWGIEYNNPDYRPLSIAADPFQLCFYNTTPGAYFLAIRMGNIDTNAILRWVWDANRGNPVRLNATLTFGREGNLVLADPDGRIAFQSNTANKGVTGLKLLSNGNLVLHDSKGKFVWQSFDYPTDTILVGQNLKVGGPNNKLVSRASVADNSNGAYSFVFETSRLALYYKSPNSPKQYVYYDSTDRYGDLTNGSAVVLFEADEQPKYTRLTFNFSDSTGGYRALTLFTRPNYNATLSFLRLDIDGNLRMYTYYSEVARRPWEITFTLFNRESVWESECQLPNKCGKFGLCENSECVGCPSPNGALAWSSSCEAKKLTSCATKDVKYYKIEGVASFINKYNQGVATTLGGCGNECTKDCKCLGYFYNTTSSSCWIAHDLLTLTRVGNSTNLGFIKTPK